MIDRLAVKRLAGRVFRASRQPASRRVILTYHAVASGPWSMPAGTFAEEMTWLAANARVVSLETLLNEDAPGLSVAVTFDDGYASVTTAAEIMQRTGHAGTVFINTAFMGGGTRAISRMDDGHYPDEPFLYWDEVRALRGMGWLIGSHGVHHLDLSTLEPRALDEQLSESKDTIEQRLGEPCRYLAYPWGHHNPAVRQAAASNGYVSAVAAVHGVVTAAADRYAVPRITVRNGLSSDDFASLVYGDWDYLHYLQSTRAFLHRHGVG